MGVNALKVKYPEKSRLNIDRVVHCMESETGKIMTLEFEVKESWETDNGTMVLFVEKDSDVKAKTLDKK